MELSAFGSNVVPGVSMVPQWQISSQEAAAILVLVTLLLPLSSIIIASIAYLSRRKRWSMRVAVVASLVVLIGAMTWYVPVLDAALPGFTTEVVWVFAFLASLATTIGAVWLPTAALAYAAGSMILNLTQLTQQNHISVSRAVLAELLLTDGITERLVPSERQSKSTQLAVMESAGAVQRDYIIPPGWSVITEVLGQVKNVLGPGLNPLERFETVTHKIELGPQRGTVDFQLVPTRDGALLSGKVMFTYQIMRLKQPPPKALTGVPDVALNGHHPHHVHSFAVARAIYRSQAHDWRRQTQDAVLAKVTSEIGKRRLAQIMDDPGTTNPTNKGILNLATDVQAEVVNVAANWGVDITALEFVELPVPDTIGQDAVVPWEAHRTDKVRVPASPLAAGHLEHQAKEREVLMTDLQKLLDTMKDNDVPPDVQARVVDLLQNVYVEGIRVSVSS